MELNAQKIPLLKIESQSLSQHIAGITTITFFEGDILEVEKSIYKRFITILQKNPWLAGKLIREKKNARVELVYETEVNIKSPKEIVNKDKYISSLNLVKEDNKHFSMVFSMSHSVADGHTYYNILNMLSELKEVYTLNVERKKNEIDKMIELIWEKPHKYITEFGHMFNAFKGMVFEKKEKYRLEKKR